MIIKMKPMNIGWAAFLPLTASALLAGCQRDDPKPYEEVRPVRTIVVGSTAGTVDARYSGDIVARYESELGFRMPGRVAARLVDVGSSVKRGQPLMRLSPEQETLQVIATSADVDAARSRVAQAHVDLDRTQQLLQRQFASRAELEQQQLALDQAEAQLRSAQAQRSVSENQRRYTVLTADRDGVVAAISAETGQVVAAGQPVVSVAADGEREVAISVPESRVEELQQARGLKVSIWARPSYSWEGALRELAPSTDAVTRTYSARIAIKQPDLQMLRLGMTASVTVQDVEGVRAIRLPLTAIVDRDGQHHVWVVNTNTSRVGLRRVTLSGPQNDSVMVTAGLNIGETVVSAGVHALQPSQRVKLPSVPATVAAVPGASK